ncbi:DUF262 domain-containing protein [Sorangium sp. So ce291]|uniref:DUF262 domain-containing protein n=1 Tax=Sorangium sp. So ce291 TaxID=3133294 RepID=UPI003F63CA8C
MQAAEAKLQRVLEGSKQFLVPHYQRPYSWQPEQWEALWRDILVLLEEENPQPHFLGSIVTSPAKSVPEGVEKRLLIDGQQRLTTLLILFALLRDQARLGGLDKLASQIEDLYLTNRYESGNDYFKLLPTQGEDPSLSDRENFMRIVRGEGPNVKTGIGLAYQFFQNKLRKADAPGLEAVHRIVISKLTLVSIILDEQDNPHRIFESLNGKGRPLSQADLIRNYFFMRIDAHEHEKTYVELWRPMQKRLGDEVVTPFVRHYLMREGPIVRETDVYSALKVRVDEDRSMGPLDHLRRLDKFSQYYTLLLRPQHEPNTNLRDRLVRLNRLEVTVAYPFMLNVYGDYARGTLSEADVIDLLDTLESFLVRRFVCAVPTHGLNKIFTPLYAQASAEPKFVEAVRKILAGKGYPRDEDFRDRLESARLYGAGDRREKTKLLLERLEASFWHKEHVVTAGLTIEHVMPQSLTNEWQAELGPTWEEDHEQLLHTLGNLTLTGYNAELDNDRFSDKKKLYAESHLELNKYFAAVEHWTAAEIDKRAETLAERALAVWPYYGPVHVPAGATDKSPVTGTIPQTVQVRGRNYPVRAWVEVAAVTMDAIANLGDEEFERVATELPKFVSRDATSFRKSSRLKTLSNGAYMEINLSAAAFHRFCVQATQLAGLGPDEWRVRYAPRAVAEAGEAG